MSRSDRWDAFTIALGFALAFVWLLSGCTPDPRLQGKPCETTCGVRLFGSNDCAGFQAAEDRAVKVFERHYPDACLRLYGWVAYVQPSPGKDHTWQSPAGKTVGGLTWRRERVIQVGSDDWPWSTYAHELLHAVESGEVLDDGHDEWLGGWQLDAIEEARR